MRLKRKSILVLTIFAIMLFHGCGSMQDGTGNHVLKGSEILKEEYDYFSGGEIQITEKLILQIGEAALKSHFKEMDKETGELHLHKVKDANTYIVEFNNLTEEGEPYTLGGKYCVAISGENGAIFKIWGEK